MAGASHRLEVYRGSLFVCNLVDSPFYGLKCIATYSAQAIFADYALLTIAAMDVARAVQEADKAELNLPVRNIELNLTANECITRMDNMHDMTIAMDIEGGLPPAYPGITCFSIATSPQEAFIVRLQEFTDSEQVAVIKSFRRLANDKTVHKILQNSLYDNFVFSWLWNVNIKGIHDDTMLSGWELHPELKKSLAMQTSVWTREPYYKYLGKVDDAMTHYRYCCLDSMVTYEISEAHRKHLSGAALEHYHHNIRLLNPTLYMQLKGIKYDVAKAAIKLTEINAEMSKLQETIDKHLGKALNINSPKQMVAALYTTLKYPPRYAKVGGRNTTRLTADMEALLNLYRGDSDPFIHAILQWRKLDALRKQLAATPDEDGRMRCSLNPVGTESGRYTCSASQTGNGYNLQTVAPKLRDLFVADEGYVMLQVDLAGADGWTVAAHCKRQGDDTMLEDYLAGIKPARVIAVLYLAQRAGSLFKILNLTRTELIDHISNADIPKWLYNAAKAVQHGSNYMMLGNTMSLNILKRGWKDAAQITYVSPSDCSALQALYLNYRYKGVVAWQNSVCEELTKSRTLRCASGHVRRFLGRPSCKIVQRSAISHEPQANTTYATNLALIRLWEDPENAGGSRVQPLLTIHDALLVQTKIADLQWAILKLKEWFNNPLKIADLTLTIPFEGGYGPTWAETKTPI
jgi:hypothetical protein